MFPQWNATNIAKKEKCKEKRTTGTLNNVGEFYRHKDGVKEGKHKNTLKNILNQSMWSEVRLVQWFSKQAAPENLL